MFSCSLCCGGRCCEMRCCEMLLLDDDDGCREEYLCVKRIICEGCKKVTWLNGLFNIYIPVCTMITPYVPLVLRENLENVGNPRHKKCVGTNLCRLVGGLSAKCADFWLLGRHVADISATFPAKAVRGCVCGCVEELWWLFFVPCEQSAPMWRNTAYGDRRKALDETRQHIHSRGS